MTEGQRKHIKRMIEYANSRNTQTYNCPVCCDDISVHDNHHGILKCSSCATRLRVERDAQFEGGMWHDLTRLIPI